MRFCCLAVAACFVVVGSSPYARAEESARDHFERGSTAYGLGHFAEAADEYEKAFALKRDAALLFDAAQAHRHAGNKERALLLYRNYLALFGDQVANVAEVQYHVAELERALAADQGLTTAGPRSPSPPPPRRAHRVWIWTGVAAGAGAVGLALGLGLGLGLPAHGPNPSFGAVRLQ